MKTTQNAIKMDDQTLINGLKNHDKAAINYLFSKFFPMVERLVMNNSGKNIEDAEDLFMSALEVVYLKVRDDKLKLSCAFSTFFYEICKRQWLKTLKRQKIRSMVTFEEQRVLSNDDLLVLEKVERYNLYREKFQLLSQGCQKVLKMALDDNSMKTISEKLGFASEGYARKRKCQCKEKLTKLIRNDPKYKELTVAPSKDQPVFIDHLTINER